MEGLEAFTFALFTRQLGYSHEEVQKICTDIRNEMKDPKMHAFFHLYVTMYPFCGLHGRYWIMLTVDGRLLVMWRMARSQSQWGRRVARNSIQARDW